MKNKFITILNTTINNSFKLKVTSKKKKIGIIVLLIYLIFCFMYTFKINLNTIFETLKSLNISYLFTGKDEIDLRLVLEKLYDLFSIKKLLLQGGGITNTYFIKEDLIDEFSLVVSPVASGEEKQPNIFEDCHEYIGQTFDLKQSYLLMKSGLYLKYVRK